MGESPLRIDFFGEDIGHAEVFRAFARRHFADLDVSVPTITERACRGGKGTAVTQLKAYLKAGQSLETDLLVVMIDANSVGFAKMRKDLRAVLRQAEVAASVVAVPDPEVEEWLMADPQALSVGLNASIELGADSDPKQRLRMALDKADVDVATTLTSIAYEVVPEMDLYKAGKTCASLEAFVSDFRAAARRLLEQS